MDSSETSARIPQIGETLGRYRILEVIGRGSSGPVYRAWDESLSREVAIKTLWPQYLAERGVRSRFEREARAAARLESPFVVRVYDIGESDGIPYIAMEFIRGGQIVADASAARPMEWRRALEIVRDVTEGLSLAHSLGIIHRDIKPANVMLGPDGRAKIADFGLARAIAEESHTVTTTGTILGTPVYLAPEIIEGEGATPLSDIYSVGILLYRLVTGRLPFEGSSPAAVLRGHLEGSIPRVSGGTGSSGPGTEIPPSIDTVIAGCTARRPEARYAEAGLVMHDLEACLAGRAPVGAQPQAISADLPFWARYFPGVERTVIEVRDEMAQARQRAAKAQRDVQNAEMAVRDLESSAVEAEKHAAGWRAVAERVLADGKEDEAREALGYATDYDRHACAYRQEIERHTHSISDLRRGASEIKRASTEVDTRGEILLARRGLARLAASKAIRTGKLPLLAGIALVAVSAALWPRTTPPERAANISSPAVVSKQIPEPAVVDTSTEIAVAQIPDPSNPEADAPPLNGVLSANFRPSGSALIGGRVTGYSLAATCAATGGPEIPSAVNPYGRVTRLVFDSGESVNFLTSFLNNIPQPPRQLVRIENGIFEAYFWIPPPRRPARRIREITGVIECYVGPANIRDIVLTVVGGPSVKAGPFNLKLIKLISNNEEVSSDENSTLAARVSLHRDTAIWGIDPSITWYIRFADQSEKRAYNRGGSIVDALDLHYNGPATNQRVIGVRAEWVTEPPIRRLGTLRAENVAFSFEPS